MVRAILMGAACAMTFGFLGTAQARTTVRSKKTIRMKKVIVKARPPKPQAFYILQRSNTQDEGRQLRHSFTQKIVRSVNGAGF